MDKEKVLIEQQEELETLFAQPEPFPIGPTIVLQLMPMDLATCVAFSRSARPLIKATLERAGDQKDLSLETLIPFLLQEIPNHLVAFTEALATAIGKSPAFVSKIPYPALTPLVGKVIAINAAFFVEGVGLLASGAREIGQESARIVDGPTL